MSNKNENKKPKKEKKPKVTYIDDGRTVADMSGLGHSRFSSEKKREKREKVNGETPWQTYWRAVRMMIVPMCYVLGILAILYLIFWFLL